MNNIEENFKTALVGKYFHSFNKDNLVVWQGVVKWYVGSDYYLVDIFEWITGNDYKTKLIKLSEMKCFEFYDNAEDMKSTYEYKLKFRHEKKRTENEESGAIKILGATLKAISISQSELIKLISDLFPNEYGLKKRTLEKYFAIANKIIEDITQ